MHLGLQAFDELLLLKRGGRVIFFGALGEQSEHLIAYFEVGGREHPVHKTCCEACILAWLLRI